MGFAGIEKKNTHTHTEIGAGNQNLLHLSASSPSTGTSEENEWLFSHKLRQRISRSICIDSITG